MSAPGDPGAGPDAAGLVSDPRNPGPVLGAAGTRGGDDARDRVALGLLALALLAFLLAPFVAEGFAFPLGPDAPVYLWWARIAGLEGISAAGERPGVPALVLALAGSTGLPLVAVVAGIEVALGTAIGAAAAALARGSELTRRRSRVGWVLAGALAGVFSVHLVAGYLANLIFTLGFLVAAVCLATRSRRGAWAAAAVLGATGLAHPYFFLVGAIVLAVTAVLAIRDARRSPPPDDADPAEAGRIAIAVLGAGAIVGTGMLTTLWGARPPDVETSRDGFLRRAGLDAELARAYRERFVDRWARYVQWASLPLAAIGIGRLRGFVARFLLAWAGVTVAGVFVGLITAWFPPDRFVTFGFAIPILAGIGAVRLPSLFRGRWRAIGYTAAAALTVAMVLGASFAWFRNEPYITEEEVRAVETAGRLLEGVEQPPLFTFLVDDDQVEAPTFLLARAWNVALASLPPDRIRTAVPFLDPRDTEPIERRAVLRVLTQMGQERARAVLGPDESSDRIPSHAVSVVLPPFAPGTEDVDLGPDRWEGDITVLSDPIPDAASAPRDPLERSSSGGIVVASLAVLAVLLVAGFGWAATALRSTFTRLATAPAFGAAALIAGGLVVDRVGIRLTGSTPLVVALLVGGGGYAAFGLQRRARSQPADEVDEQPHQ